MLFFSSFNFLVFSRMQLSRNELRKKEKFKEKEELKEDIDFILEDLW